VGCPDLTIWEKATTDLCACGSQFGTLLSHQQSPTPTMVTPAFASSSAYRSPVAANLDLPPPPVLRGRRNGCTEGHSGSTGVEHTWGWGDGEKRELDTKRDTEKRILKRLMDTFLLQFCHFW
jgi:hypothetical protein